MRKLLFLLLYLFSFTSISASSVTDSLKTVLEQSSSDTARLHILNELIKLNLWNNTAQARQYAVTYDSIAKTTGIHKYMGKGENFLGMCHHVKGEAEKATEQYLKAIRHFEKAKDTLFTGILYNNIGACFELQEKPAQSIVYYEKALSRFESVNDQEWINNVNVNLAVQFNNTKNYQKAIEHNQKALKYFQAAGDLHKVGIVLANLGATYLYDEQFEKSLEYSKRSLDYINPEQDITVYISSKINIALAYISSQQARKAKPFLDESLQLARKHQSLAREKRVLDGLTNYYRAIGDYKSALNYFQEFVTIKDSIFNEAKDKAIVEATTRFETEKKQQEIDLLQAQNEVQDLKLAQARRQSLFYILGILGFGLLALLLFYAFQTKKKSLAEKELLLKEIHHRVKNNLQVVTSLLNIQQRRIKDKHAIAAIQESKTRVETMSLIHQSLYQNNDLSNIDAKDYIQKLLDYIFQTYKIDQNKIRYQLNVQQIKMDMDTLIPLGLIINELVNNAIKHAFNKEDEGTISIALEKAAQKIQLSISDNGRGLPSEDVLLKSNSFGFKMVRAFVKKLNASMEIFRTDGTRLSISFDQ